MKVVCNKTINGVERLIVVTTATGDQGLYVINIVGVGKPFWIWPSLPYPAATIIGCDFTDAPICTSNSVTNNALIAAITATPEDVLTTI